MSIGYASCNRMIRSLERQLLARSIAEAAEATKHKLMANAVGNS